MVIILGSSLCLDRLIHSPKYLNPPTPLILDTPIMWYLRYWEYLRLGGWGGNIRGRELVLKDASEGCYLCIFQPWVACGYLQHLRHSQSCKRCRPHTVGTLSPNLHIEAKSAKARNKTHQTPSSNTRRTDKKITPSTLTRKILRCGLLTHL